jgi:threonylcarbamoyladenosine tRNA methylthiotransferase MtaB
MGQIAGKVFFQTLGCKVNSYETDGVRKLFEEAGFITTQILDDCDICVINTCTVTGEADRKSRQMIRRAKKIAPKAIIAAMGCQIQMNGNVCEADVSSGTLHRSVLVEKSIKKLDSLRNGTASSVQTPVTSTEEREYEEFGSVVSREGTRAFIKIEDGCDNFCSYCVIPYARGRVVSRKPEAIIEEAVRLGSAGFREIVLTGIHICSYGKDWNDCPNALFRLLEELDKIDSISRIRLGSIEPNSLDDRFISKLSEMKKLCPHFHISLQSGSDSILRRMGRRYDTSRYADVVQKLRSSFKELSLTTDIIVGFPGETSVEHTESLKFCEAMQFSKIHVFPFSPRKGTRAAEMLPQIDPDVIAERSKEFLRLSQKMFDTFALEKIGKTADVLFESISGDGSISGYSKDYFKVILPPGSKAAAGSELKVRITGQVEDAFVSEIL